MSDVEIQQPSFLDELKRRRVVRVALVYGASAFAVLQAADILVPALHLPPWAVTLVVVLLALGFPVALALSWVLELTPAGIRVTPRAEPAGGTAAPALFGRRTLLVSGGLVLAGLAFGAGWVLRPDTRLARAEAAAGAAGAAVVSVAVLPFADLSEDRSQEYFGDGLAEELLNALRAAGLSVASRTSSFAFKGQSLSARQIAAELGVDHVVEGSVRKAGDRLRISAQVIDVRSDRLLWSETFDRTTEDIFSIQAEIAQSVASALRVRLAAAAGPTAGTRSVEAYDLYLLGLYHWNRRTSEGLLRALELFTRATESDPTFARAWAGLSFTYSVLPEYGDYDVQRARTEARAAAEQAVRLDPASVEARTALANAVRLAGDLEGSLLEFDRALELDPNFATAHHWRAIVLDRLDRHAEARQALLEARRLDPTSLPIHSYIAFNLAQQGRTEEALAENEALLQRAPDYRYALVESFVLGAELGRARQYAPQLRGYLRGIGEDPGYAEAIVRGVEDPRHRDAAVAVIDEILSRQTSVRELSSLTDLYAVLQAAEPTLRLLEAQTEAMYILPSLTRYDFIRDDRRFRALAAQRPVH